MTNAVLRMPTSLSAALGFCLITAFAPAAHGQEDHTIIRPAFPAGTGPRILFDTAHWNPPLSQGRYEAVAELLRADGYRVVPGAVGSGGDDLAQYRLLLLVTPYATDPVADRAGAHRVVFSEAESAALEAWVRAGGSLLLVVGHEPNAAANADLVRRFGVDVRNGTAMDSTAENNWVGGHAGCHGCLKFTLDNGLLRQHPITSGRDASERVTSVISAVGTSLMSSSAGHTLLALGPAAYDVLQSGDTLSASGRAQGIAFTHGGGRVVLLGDGSILSGFTYGVENPRFRRWWPRDPDNRQFTMNLVRWLSGLLPAEPAP